MATGLELSMQPAFIRDTWRPGMTTAYDAEVWAREQGVIDGIVRSVFGEKKADAVEFEFERAQDERVKGVARVVYAVRQEPPMTVLEARVLGNRIVEAYQAESPEAPEYCDVVLPILSVDEQDTVEESLVEFV